jgi:hypothetical protein
MTDSTAMVGIVHVHTDYSHDGRDSLESLVPFCRARRICFVGLTDHAEDFDRERFEQYQAHCARASTDDVRLIAGLEFRFAGYPGLHLLALGLSEWIEPVTPSEFVAQVRGRSRFTIVAHPILPDYQVPPDVLAHIDAIEVWNATYNTRYFPDFRAIRLLHAARSERRDLVATAGLDQHDARNDRETRVILPRHSDDPLAELKAGRFFNVGRTMRFDPAVSWSPLRLNLLSAARWCFDRFERMQESVSRRRLKRKAKRA